MSEAPEPCPFCGAPALEGSVSRWHCKYECGTDVIADEDGGGNMFPDYEQSEECKRREAAAGGAP